MKTFEYRLRPTHDQGIKLEGILQATRLMYNGALQELNEHFRMTGKYLNYFTQDRHHGKKEHPDIPAVLVDTTLQRLHRSFKVFFEAQRHGKQYGRPRFKSCWQWSSIQFRDKRHYLKPNGFFAGRELGVIRVHLTRPTEGDFKHARIVKRPSGWYLQCVCDVPAAPLPKTGESVGIDVGLRHFLTDSNGRTVQNPHTFKKSLKKLCRLQRTVSRREKGSNRRRKAIRVVARYHERITNQRLDFLHKTASRYVQENDLICVEDLNVGEMVRNNRLARGIMDASWIQFFNLLSYKAASAGREFIKVPPRYTSQKCSECGETVQKSLSVRTHICPHCGYIGDRDVNAARNILRLGRSLQEARNATAIFS